MLEGRQIARRQASRQQRYKMNDEPKSAAEMKEIRLNRKRSQEIEGIKAMAEKRPPKF